LFKFLYLTKIKLKRKKQQTGTRSRHELRLLPSDLKKKVESNFYTNYLLLLIIQQHYTVKTALLEIYIHM